LKIIEFGGNTLSANWSYHRTREGPNYFVGYYKNSSRLFYDPKDAWRLLGPAKFTDCGKALKEWCLEIDEAHRGEIKEGFEDGSFASDIKTVI
jgi:hypothetical protein